jgi:hypothetical protein
MSFRNPLILMSALFAVGTGSASFAQEISITLAVPDQTGYVNGPLISFDATIQNLTDATVDIVSSNLTSTNMGRADFNSLTDINDNFSYFSLGADASVTIPDMFDFTVNPTSVSSTPVRDLNPLLDYSYGQYTLTTGDSSTSSADFVVRLEENPSRTPEPGGALLISAFACSIAATRSLLLRRRVR